MRSGFLGVCWALALYLPNAASAETCEETFVRLLADGNGAGPTRTQITQEIKGGMTSRSYFYSISPTHWMSETIEPQNLPSVLVHGDVMFISADKGKSWQKLRTIDSEGNLADAKNAAEKDSQTATNPSCGEETLGEVPHDTAEALYTLHAAEGMNNRAKFWVNRETGFISRAVYEIKGGGFESTTTQLIWAAPGLALPEPQQLP